jgi:hypothetical protein
MEATANLAVPVQQNNRTTTIPEPEFFNDESEEVDDTDWQDFLTYHREVMS